MLDRSSTKLIDLYVSLMLISTIVRSAAFIAYLPTVASVAVLGIIWAAWALVIAYIVVLIKSSYRRRQRKAALEQQYIDGR